MRNTGAKKTIGFPVKRRVSIKEMHRISFMLRFCTFSANTTPKFLSAFHLTESVQKLRKEWLLMDLDLYFQKSELIPAIVVEEKNKEVLMLAYMNRESLQKTLETGYTWFYSRSRQELWNKGATSGLLQKVISIKSDCDDDTLLVTVHQTGVACHTGAYSCFFKEIYNLDNDV